MNMKVRLETFLQEVTEKTVENNQHPVLTSSKSGLYLQSDYFNKQVASKDNIGYKIIKKGQFTYRAMSDTGEFYPNMLECVDIGIVSPAYPVFEIVDTNIIEPEYLKYFFKSNVFQYSISSFVQGSTRTSVKFGKLKTISIELPDTTKQNKIVEILKIIESIIEARKEELNNLDELVKARFVELFGDPISNHHGFDKVTLSELADIKIGPFGSLLHKEDYIEGGHALLNPSHIIDGKVVPDNKLTVSVQKYEELSAYHLKTGDVVMGRRGEMGRCAVVPCDGYLCGTGSLMIRTKGKVTADYIQKIISFPSFKKSIEDMAVGQTMPNLNVPIVSNFQIIKPPIEIQKSYYDFVEQVDKSKVAVQKALDETQTLFDSLMQEYFG
ncbi:MAG: restriction endonuclease subunit S [Acutalibacteraceae bacterium]|nr:restriction endonuclease subunit S [Acutalibacteraceae bacterium]